MATLWRKPSVELDVKVVRAAGVEVQLEGSLFVRYYVPAGDGRQRIRVDTREVPCGGGDDVFWGELARFELADDGSVAAAAPPGKVSFELRWRSRATSGWLAALLGTRRPSSRVLARAELAVAVGAKSASSESSNWLTLSPAGRELDGRCKAPKLLVEVHAVAAAAAADNVVAMKASKFSSVNECCSAGERCGHCGWVGSEEDMFLAATFAE